MKTQVKIDRIKRSSRKTVALYVLADGSLEVRAPLRLSQAAIQDFANSKSDWIARQRDRLAKSIPQNIRNGYANGSRIWLLGQALTLEFIQTDTRRIHQTESKLLLSASLSARTEKALTAWYREQARRVIAERLQYYLAKSSLRCAGIRINAARRRWGSCGAGNRLNFPFRLVMAPLEIIDYVVVHELAHTAVRNHGPAFWAQVAAILPDYRQRRKWLQINGGLLDLALEADPGRITPVSPAKAHRARKSA